MFNQDKMTTLIWKSILYTSIEHLQLWEEGNTTLAKSKILGSFEDKIYSVEYGLEINKDWKVSSFDIEFDVNNNKKRINGVRKNNEWEINGKIEQQFTGIDFIDIPVTPFTNTLPIRNLRLHNGQEKDIKVIYIDILEDSIKPLKQKYRKNSDANYRYENIPNDFEADIEVDESGLVTFYPSLFERVNRI